MDTITSIKYCQSVFEAQFEKDTIEATRKVTFVLASEATGRAHRNKYVYNWDNWNLDNYNSNPIVSYQHQVQPELFQKSSPDDIIGTSETWLDKYKGSRALMGAVTFEPADLNPQADKIMRKVMHKSLRSASVGVVPTGPIKTEYFKNSKNEIVDVAFNFPGQDLVEWSIVHLPADPAAVRKSSVRKSVLEEIASLLPDMDVNIIQSMKVSDILDMIEGKQRAEPDLNKYKQMLNALKK